MNKPRLSIWAIWNMSFGFLGIQFGWGLQMANMSSIYQYLGAKPEELALLWLAAILTIVTGYDYLRAGLIHMAADHIKPAEQPSHNRERRAAEQVS